MTHWFPTNKQIIKAFIFNFLGWTLLAILYNSLTTMESLVLGFGAGVFFTLMYIAQLWNNENSRKHLLKAYQKSTLVNSHQWNIVNHSELIGQVNGFDIKITPVIDATSTTKFNVEVNLSSSPQLNNHLNIDRALGKLKYSMNGATLSISNWSPKLWNYRQLEKVIGKLQELLNKLENVK